jgi:hypothetical protein
MSDPPQPRRVSPDGKFYWDGQEWMPMQRTSPRRRPWVAIALVAFAIIFVFVLLPLVLWLWSPG